MGILSALNPANWVSTTDEVSPAVQRTADETSRLIKDINNADEFGDTADEIAGQTSRSPDDITWWEATLYQSGDNLTSAPADFVDTVGKRGVQTLGVGTAGVVGWQGLQSFEARQQRISQESVQETIRRIQENPNLSEEQKQARIEAVRAASGDQHPSGGGGGILSGLLGGGGGGGNSALSFMPSLLDGRALFIIALLIVLGLYWRG